MLLDGFEGRDFAGGSVCAEEVPGVESGEVLQGSEELVAANGCGYEFEVVGYRGVVDERIGDHCEGLLEIIDLRGNVRTVRYGCRKVGMRIFGVGGMACDTVRLAGGLSHALRGAEVLLPEVIGWY